MLDLVLTNGEVALPGGPDRKDIGIQGGKIVSILPSGAKVEAKETLDCSGLTILPGVIDSQVHFREPGLEHKEDLESGTRSAIMGGITTIFEMPNTNPATITVEALEHKLKRARETAWTDHAFFVGGTPEDVDWGMLESQKGCSGVKIFMGSSTGSLLVSEDEHIANILKQTRRRVAVHCEDEERLKERKSIAVEGCKPEFHPVWRDEESALRATRRLLKIAREQRAQVHVLHVTTRQEMELLADYKDVATVEVTPQHLTLHAPQAYEELGTLAQMNPPIRSKEHQDGLWWGIEQGIVDVIGSDHAPHTLQEKAKQYPNSPSGMPGVQTILPLMLDHVKNGRLSLLRLVDLMCTGPARIFGILNKGRIALGYDADFSIVDMNREMTLCDEMMESKCGWTPFDNKTISAFPVTTILRGQIVVKDCVLQTRPEVKPVEFQSTFR